MKLISKIMESFVLEWTLQEVACKFNQYGGIKGCSSTHMLINVWQKILSDLAVLPALSASLCKTRRLHSILRLLASRDRLLKRVS